MKEIINAVTAKHNMTEKRLSEHIGINRTTLHRWKNKPPHAIKAVSKLFDLFTSQSVQDK